MEIRIRPPLWPFSRVLGVAGVLWMEWKLASIPLSVPYRIVATIVMTLFGGFAVSLFDATELITVGAGEFVIRRQFFGVGVSKKFRLRSISNLRYQLIPSGPNKGPMDTIAFCVPEDMGIVYHFGRHLTEEAARDITSRIDNYRSHAISDPS